MGKTYKEAGVDIQTGDNLIDRIKPLVRSTFNDKVLTDIGLFGGFYDGKFSEYDHPILVSSTDGVGTKLKIAFLTGRHDTVGNCLVNHCVDDILACGAEPLFFLDYFSTGRLDEETGESVIKGFVNGCLDNGAALIGGETAEMPSIYADGEYDISGTIVGVVDKSKIVNGKNIQKGDVLLGLPSSGLHTNGYSLARAILLENNKVSDRIEELSTTIGDELLKIHKSYLKAVKPLLDKDLLKGISHITGGGIEGNTKRILPEGRKLRIDWESWDRLPVFDVIQKLGDVDESEMRHVFNLGIGMILVVDKENVDNTLKLLVNENVKIIGEIE